MILLLGKGQKIDNGLESNVNNRKADRSKIPLFPSALGVYRLLILV
jgi:hypothetical protein